MDKPDLDRTTLLKAIVHVNPYRADRDEMGEACIFCGEWALMNEGVKHLDNCIWKLAQVASSEAPAEAFTAKEVEEMIRVVNGAFDSTMTVFWEKRLDAMLTDYARLVRERHTGKGEVK